MTAAGVYLIRVRENKQTQYIYLGLMVVVILALMCFRLWPIWLKKGIWYISFYLLVFLIATAILRLVLWIFLYHFGLEVWLFPNYFIDSNDPRDSFLPVWSYEVREDSSDFKAIIFRLISGALICYMGYQFTQDEKNMEDLRDLASHGLTDLFEYGQEFMVGGNALGDNSQAANETKTESFTEKYKKELRKDIDDLGLDDEEEEENAESTEEGSDAAPEEGSEDAAAVEEEAETEEVEEEEVSSADMFSEM
uniref:Translocation protein SEC62 n=1 Tax=Strombidium inclinatum TaxID=197538 RepID=A0A7S3MZY8_9SPIT|mmetsp:Transcript_33419/g.51294  ORF Transcript_33419/g.51294 Transcript_33419/m.51294 type:complete len:251 (+) Transcript_33419:426-1178(+)